MTSKKYCPFCKSKKPLWRAGKSMRVDGSHKVQYQCQSCYRRTVNPRSSKYDK